MNWQDYFTYDVESASGIRWKVKPNRKIRLGDVAGTARPERWAVRVEGRLYLVHRVIYEMFYGEIGDLDIDHIDRNGLNNRIENLRAVPHVINMRNLSKQENNKSGVTGVNYKEIYDKRKNYLYKGWRTSWRDLSGKNCTKLFSTRKYGYDLAFQLACEHREKMIAELNEQGAGYSPTHGK